MPSRVPVFAITALIGLAMMLPAHAAGARHNHGQTPAPAQTPAQRWATDAPLRQGMRDIRAAVGALGHYEHGHLGPREAAILAGQVEDHVNLIIAECKLEPEADAALHAIIAPLLRNAGELRRNPRALHAIAAMRDALSDYDRSFQDTGDALD
jgi:hypothetical protein